MEKRWWEYYAVRYLVGTILGAAIIAFLNTEPGSPYEWRLSLGDDGKGAAFLGVGVAAAFGFAYCYIASAPVLTVHATRAHLRLSALRSRAVLNIGCLVGGLVIAWFLVNRYSRPTGLTALVALVAIPGFQLGLVIRALADRFQTVGAFYWELAEARAQAARASTRRARAVEEFLTSYRHLREHGNAVTIVVLELVLAYILFALPSARCALFAIGLWLLPGATSWVVGTALESRLLRG
jgi:hypothetical protein